MKFTNLAGWAPDMVVCAGAIALSVGAGLVYAPAGFIVGGVLLILAGLTMARGA